MPRADTSIQRPSGLLSAAAAVVKVVDQLRHSMSKRNLRQPSAQPLSRTQREEAERQAKSVQIKKKFEYLRERYDRMKVVEEHHSETDGAGNDHLRKRVPKRPPRGFPIQEQPQREHGVQLDNQKSLRIDIAVSEDTPTPPTPPPKDPSPTTVNPTPPVPPNDTADLFISLTASTCSTSRTESPFIHKTDLTWNSALTTILTSPHVNAIFAAEIRARESAHQASNEMGGGEQVYVDMCAVCLVPNFSYPLPSAKWHERGDFAEWERKKGCGGDAGVDGDFISLHCEPSPVLKSNGEDRGVGENFDSLKCEPSPVLMEIGWAEAERDLMQLLEPVDVKLHRILSQVNPRSAVRMDIDRTGGRFSV